MANDLGGVWRTVGGRRIFIKDGQDLASAMKESGKFNKNQIESKIEGIDNKKNEKNNEFKRELKKSSEELKKYNIEVDDNFLNNLDSRLAKEQLNAINNIVKNDVEMQEYLKKYPLKVTSEPQLFSDATYGHVPQDASIHQITYNSRLNYEETITKVKELREKGRWISNDFSNVPDTEYITYHEMGHLKEQMAVQKYYEKNPKFKEKYIKKLDKAKTQNEYDIITRNMHDDTLYHLEEEYLKPIQEKNGTLNKSGGRNGTIAYGDYGTKEMSSYGNKNGRNEFFSESNVIYSNPTPKGKQSQLYKDFKDFIEEVYK